MIVDSVEELDAPAPSATSSVERTTVHLLPGFLSHTDIVQVVEAARDRGPWQEGRSVCEALQCVPHDVAYSSTHVALFLHREGHFATSCPELYERILLRMRSEQRERSDALNIRCIELHTYTAGGGLLDPGHCDHGSVFTMSVLLSEPAGFGGGEFVTWRDEQPIAHPMSAGDAILFHSEKCHNVSTVTSGVRQSLVIEIWRHGANSTDRHS